MINPYKRHEELERKRQKEEERYNNMSDEEKQDIEERELEMTKRVTEKLTTKGIEFFNVFSYFSGNDSLRYNTAYKDVIITSFNEPLFPDRDIRVVTDFETMEMLYVWTGVVNYVEIKDFF